MNRSVNVAKGRKIEGADPATLWNQIKAGECIVIQAKIGSNCLPFRILNESDLSKQFEILEREKAPIVGCYAVT